MLRGKVGVGEAGSVGEVPRVREEALDQAGRRRAIARRQEREHLRVPAAPAGPDPFPPRELLNPGRGGISDREAVDATQDGCQRDKKPLLVGVGEGTGEFRGERLTLLMSR